MRAITFKQLGDKLVNAAHRNNRFIAERGIQKIKVMGSSPVPNRPPTPKPKNLKDLQETHHIPTKFHKYFEQDSRAGDESAFESAAPKSKKRQIMKKTDTTTLRDTMHLDEKKHAKISETIHSILEESADLYKSMRKDCWDVCEIRHTKQKAILYFALKKNDDDENADMRKEEMIGLVTRYQPALQKAFNSRMLKFNRWSANKNEIPRIILRHASYLDRAEQMNALLDQIQQQSGCVDVDGGQDAKETDNKQATPK